MSVKATLREAKTLNTMSPKVVIFPDGNEENMFGAWVNKDVTEKQLTAMLKSQADKLGFAIFFDHVGTGDNGRPFVQFTLTKGSSKRLPRQRKPEVTINVDPQISASGVVISHPANLGFQPKPKRLAHMAWFMTTLDWKNGEAEHLEAAFVNRLFAEGMLERNPDNLHEFRPTAGGKVWFETHSKAS